MNSIEQYLGELRDIRASGGVPETSGYGALATLLNEIGAKLKPKVRCTINPRNAGAGIPDGGLFTANQFEKGKMEPLPGQLPARGALEVKPVGDDARQIAASAPPSSARSSRATPCSTSTSPWHRGTRRYKTLLAAGAGAASHARRRRLTRGGGAAGDRRLTVTV